MQGKIQSMQGDFTWGEIQPTQGDFTRDDEPPMWLFTPRYFVFSDVQSDFTWVESDLA